jgi:NAD(P)-dependent dehydrogenase (short-subunit alcohol dehydrogenase family)
MITENYEPSAKLMSGRTILITGATDGIGKALSLKLSSYPCNLILLGKNKLKLDAIKKECTGCVANIEIFKLDLMHAKGEDYQGLIDMIESKFISIDCLVHNAAILGDLAPVEHYDIGLWQQVIHVNLTSVFILTKCLLPLLKIGKFPSITFTSSGVGSKGKAFWGAYSVSKFGIEGFAQILSEELKNSNIKVSIINPGATNTNMRAKAYPAEDKSSIKEPEDVISAYLYLLSPEFSEPSGSRFSL